MTKIKLCGMYRECDIDYVNEALPDYIGFILNFPKSHRNITSDKAKLLKSRLDKKIKAVGVFVDSPYELCAEYVNEGIIDIIQLHGNEDNDYINKLRKICSAEIIKAVKIQSADDIIRADGYISDYLLLDSGTGSGKTFNHELLMNTKLNKPYFLAGGLTPENIAKAAADFKPYGVDLSSGIETDKIKDRNKIIQAVKNLKAAVPEL